MLLVLAGLIMLAGATDVLTASPRLCGLCHEMKPRVATWGQSAHASVTCVECHQQPRPWTQAPASLYDRLELLGRDTVRHLSGEYQDPVETRAPGSEPIADEVCLQCHDPNRKATSGYRILIDHAEHAARNGSCVSCHVRTAHPLDTRGNALSLMSQCFTCHGTPEQPKASAKCDVCHPSDYEPKPESHSAATWMRSHGKVAVSDPKQCTMCHEKEYCTGCHGLEMPHPEGWEKGATGHSVVAKTDRAVCERCHGGRADMCTMCHHEGYEPAKGPWAKQHFIDVRKRGTTFCLSCHSPLYCADCHKR